MRVLVEQTYQVASQLIDTLPEGDKPEVHLLMGGEEVGQWCLFPEKPAVLIGTQDMLLSRALNRGYASGRARWPMEFGLLHQDALWVMDEVQLMDVGLATSAQLQTFREEEGEKSLRPTRTWWMSATLQPEWLKSIDTEDFHQEWTQSPIQVKPQNRRGAIWDVSKELEKKSLENLETSMGKFAREILKGHSELNDEGYGKISLVIVNTVKKAVAVYGELKKQPDTEHIEIKLIHSRFRPDDRNKWVSFLNRESCRSGANRIIVSTQVVEAGVDVSAGLLVSQLAPWPSLVQRFGRCARYGGGGKVVVVHDSFEEKVCLPYRPEELKSAWNALKSTSRVGIHDLENYESELTSTRRRNLYPYQPNHLIIRHELDELFDTTPDLTGADIDVSRFIRSGKERDVNVFWRELPDASAPDGDILPRREEFCSVSIVDAKKWIKDKKEGIWTWDWIDGEWVPAKAQNILPGRILLAASKIGGYSEEFGFKPNSKNPVKPVACEVDNQGKHRRNLHFEEADGRHDSEALSYTEGWKTIAFHGKETAQTIKSIYGSIFSNLDKTQSTIQELLCFAAEMHDVGKAHPAFQGSIKPTAKPKRQDLAKAPDSAWESLGRLYRCEGDGDRRPGFRHELASGLMLISWLRLLDPCHPALLGKWVDYFESMEQPLDNLNQKQPAKNEIEKTLLGFSEDDFNTLLYFVVSHHGKVRMGLHASARDQDYRPRSGDSRGLPIRGIREQDMLPSVNFGNRGATPAELQLTLEPAKMGLSRETGAGWRERSENVLKRFGPFTLAYLEALFRSADARASQLNTVDSTLEGKP